MTQADWAETPPTEKEWAETTQAEWKQIELRLKGLNTTYHGGLSFALFCRIHCFIGTVKHACIIAHMILPFYNPFNQGLFVGLDVWTNSLS